MRAAGLHTSEPLQHDLPRQPAPAETRVRADGLEQTDPVRLVQPANTVCAEAPVWSFGDQVQLRLVTGCAHELLVALRRRGRFVGDPLGRIFVAGQAAENVPGGGSGAGMLALSERAAK